MISFQFSERKVTEAFAFLLQKPSTDQKNYTKLLKLLYLADRQALSKWGRPISGDRFVNMPNGPVLSRTYDLVKYHPPGSFWSAHISPKKGYEVELLKDPGIDDFSPAELRVLSEVREQRKEMNYSQVISECHRLPEWDDPTPHGHMAEDLPHEEVMKYGGVSVHDLHPSYR